ncbi:mitogen-activated protein kinase-binding protein 1-like isoform X1 [Sycon ciliatum]|uniref:mitogen-activated protein kinase-binding protein 1-like isoform X1 n=1 Tax=Sycon ciliatum TaxID=27933 RepID=UPI0031F6C26A
MLKKSLHLQSHQRRLCEKRCSNDWSPVKESTRCSARRRSSGDCVEAETRKGIAMLKRKPGRASSDTNLHSTSGKIVKRVRKAKQPGGGVADKAELERVLGISAVSNASLSCCEVKGIVAYPAGCVVVLYYPRKNRQQHIQSPARRPISCLSFSQDGNYLCTGESGHQPMVRVWELLDTPVQVQELQGHRFGISMVSFSPKGKYLVSVGYEHDMNVIVWKWRNGSQLASNKVSVKVSALSFSHDGSYFVTVGNRHVRFWYLDTSSKVSQAQPLQGRSAVLGEHRGLNFVSVACGSEESGSNTYAVTSNGLLMQFSQQRRLEKFVTLKTPRALSIALGRFIYCGCIDGVVRVFDLTTLCYVTSLPNPHPLGVDVASIIDTSSLLESTDGKSGLQFPDVCALVLDDTGCRLTCVYRDRSMYVWDVSDVNKVGKTRSFLNHSSAIWDVEMYPEAKNGSISLLPPGTFITAGADSTIRFWNVGHASSTMFRNIYSKELVRIIDVQKGDQDNAVPGGDNCGVRALRASPDGRCLASGDRSGNLRIHDLKSFQETALVLAHDGEILSLDFGEPLLGRQFLASCSRDRLVHVFDTEQCDLVQTLDDHSAAVTDVKFAFVDDTLNLLSCSNDKSLMFRSMQEDETFTCTHHVAGKSSCQSMAIPPEQDTVLAACQDRLIRLYHCNSGKSTRSIKLPSGDAGGLVKIELDPSGSVLATCSSDRSISLIDIASGEVAAILHGHAETITGIKFTLDCRRLISVSADGCIFIWRLPSSLVELMQEKLLEQRRASGLFAPLVESELALTSPAPSASQAVHSTANSTFTLPPGQPDDLQGITPGSPFQSPGAALSSVSPVSPENDYRFSMGQLPRWARGQLLSDSAVDQATDQQTEGVTRAATLPRAQTKWAQRVDVSEGLTVASQLEGDNGVLRVDDAWSGPRPRLSSPGSDSPSGRTFCVETKHASSTPAVFGDSTARSSTPRDLDSSVVHTPTSDRTFTARLPDAGQDSGDATVVLLAQDPQLSPEGDIDTIEEEDESEEDTTIYLPKIANDAEASQDFFVTESRQESPPMDDTPESDETMSSYPGTPLEEATSPPAHPLLSPHSEQEFQPICDQLADSLFGSAADAPGSPHASVTSRQPPTQQKLQLQLQRRLSMTSRFLARSKQTSGSTAATRPRPTDLPAVSEAFARSANQAVLLSPSTASVGEPSSMNSSMTSGASTTTTRAFTSSNNTAASPIAPVRSRTSSASHNKSQQATRASESKPRPSSAAASKTGGLLPVQKRSGSAPSSKQQLPSGARSPSRHTGFSPSSSDSGIDNTALRDAEITPPRTPQSPGKSRVVAAAPAAVAGKKAGPAASRQCSDSSVPQSPGEELAAATCSEALDALEGSFEAAMSHFSKLKGRCQQPQAPPAYSRLLERYSSVFTRLHSELGSHDARTGMTEELSSADASAGHCEGRSLLGEDNTVALLERYSDALCSMVQEKLQLRSGSGKQLSDLSKRKRDLDKT